MGWKNISEWLADMILLWGGLAVANHSDNFWQLFLIVGAAMLASKTLRLFA